MKYARWIFDVLLLVCLYYVTGRIGLLLAIPPGYATALFPPAGIALAFLVLRGQSRWPGVLVGSMLMNLVITLQGQSLSTLSDSTIALSLLIGIGATLQAIVGMWALRTFTSYPQTFDDVRLMARFVCCVVVLASLINSNTGALSLAFLQKIYWSDYLSTWFYWWVGDGIGVMLFTPALLLLFDKRILSSPRRKAASLIPPLLTLVLTVGAFELSKSDEVGKARVDFESNARSIVENVEDGVQQSLDTLYAVQSYYNSSEFVDRNEFKQFISRSLERIPSIQAIGWVPRIPHDARDTVESRARAEGVKDFALRQRNDDGDLVIASTRREYFPVLYAEPAQSNREMLGYDLYIDSEARHAMRQARDSGKPVATGLLQFTLHHEDPSAFIILMPVYANGTSTETIEQRRANLQGFALGAFRASTIVALAMQTSSIEGFDLKLYDVNDKTQNPMHATLAHESQERGFRTEHLIQAGEHQWLLVVHAPSTLNIFGLGAQTWLVLLGGLLLTGAFQAFLLTMTGQATSTQRLVNERTRELGETATFLDSIIENIPHMIFVKEAKELRFVRFNKAGEKLLGYSRKDLIGKNDHDLFPANQANAFTTKDREVLKERNVQIVEEEEIDTKAHGKRLLHTTKIPILNNQGEPIFLLGISQDITERKSIEKRLEENEEVFALLKDLSLDGFWDWNIETGVVELSARWKASLGYQEHELNNHVDTWLKLLHPDDKDKGLEAVRLHIEEGEPYSVVLRYFKKDGSIAWILAQGVAVKNAQGKAVRMFGIHTDVTRIKRVEVELQQKAEELERSNSELEQFAFVASHDLNEPLRKIQSFGDLLERRYRDNLDTKGHEYIDIIRTSAERMRMLISDLLDLSRVATRGNPFVKVALGEIVDEVLQDIEPLVDETGASITYRNLPTIEADRLQMRQLFQNLISNAIKYRRPDLPPVINIEADPAVAIETTGQLVHTLRVRDNGIGFDQAHGSSIFLPFKRLVARTQYPGTGIGLAICQKIVRRHGGTIEAESSLGHGSTFTFTLPRNQDEDKRK